MTRIRFMLWNDENPTASDYRLVVWPAVPRKGEIVRLHTAPKHGTTTEKWYVHTVDWCEAVMELNGPHAITGHPTGELLVEIELRRSPPALP